MIEGSSLDFRRCVLPIACDVFVEVWVARLSLPLVVLDCRFLSLGESIDSSSARADVHVFGPENCVEKAVHATPFHTTNHALRCS